MTVSFIWALIPNYSEIIIFSKLMAEGRLFIWRDTEADSLQFVWRDTGLGQSERESGTKVSF